MLSESKKRKGLYCESDSQLAAKFFEAGFGFEEEGSYLFHPLEAAYLHKIGKTTFAKGTLPDFVSLQKKRDRAFPFAFAVYLRIRATGRLVRPYMKKTNFFRVYAPGVGREDSRPSQLVCLLPGKAPSAKSLEAQIKVAHLARLELIIACGSEKEAKFYKVSVYNF